MCAAGSCNSPLFSWLGTMRRSPVSVGCLTSDRSPLAADRVFVDTGRTRRNVCFCRELVALSSILEMPRAPQAPMGA